MGESDSRAMSMVSRAMRKKKQGYGDHIFNKLTEKYEIKKVKTSNGVTEFILGGKTFYYGRMKRKIRLKGTIEWDDIEELLNREFDGDIPLREDRIGLIMFGKYRGRTMDEILTIDPGYIDWCMENIDGFLEKIGLENI